MARTTATAAQMTRETYLALSIAQRTAAQERMEEEVSSYVRSFLAPEDDETPLAPETALTFGETFVETFGAQRDVEADEAWSSFRAQRHSVALAVTVETLYRAGLLVTGRGRKSPIPQKSLAAQYAVTQPRISQLLSEIMEADEAETTRTRLQSERRAARKSLREAAKESGLIVDGEDCDDVTAAISAVVSSGDGDAYEAALSSVRDGRVPYVAPKGLASVETLRSRVDALDALLVKGLDYSSDDEEELHRIGATLVRLGEYVGTLLAESAQESTQESMTA